MISVNTFANELAKIGAHRVRQGRRPIRAQALADKERVKKASELPWSYYSKEMPGVSQEMLDAAHKRRVIMAASQGLQGGAGGMLAGGALGGIAGLVRSRTLGGGASGVLQGASVGIPLGAAAGMMGGIGAANRVHGAQVEELLRRRGLVDEEGEEVKKTSSTATEVGTGVGKALWKHKGKIGLVGGGIASWETGKQGLKDYQLGRAYRKQMEGRAE